MVQVLPVHMFLYLMVQPSDHISTICHVGLDVYPRVCSYPHDPEPCFIGSVNLALPLHRFVDFLSQVLHVFR